MALAGSGPGTLFAQARATNLPEVAEHLGYSFTQGNNKLHGNKCPNCGEGRAGGNAVSLFIDTSGCWRWNCFCCGKGGTVIDFVSFDQSISGTDAARRILGLAAFAPSIKVVNKEAKSNADTAALTEVIRLLQKKGLQAEPEVEAYLDSRFIRRRTVREAVDRGLIRFMPADPRHCVDWLEDEIGKEKLVKAGLWKEGSKWPAIAFRPLISTLPGQTSAEFRMIRAPATADEPKAIRYGSAKWPWWWKSEEPKTASILVVEGVIDLLSVVQMGGDRSHHIMAIPGVQTWNAEWIKQAADKNGCSIGSVGIDRDRAGDEKADEILGDIEKAGFTPVRLLPENKDWNLDLQAGRIAM